MAVAFQWVRSLAGGRDLERKSIQLDSSATVQKGDLLVFTSGKVKRAATQTALINFVCSCPQLPAAGLVADAAVTVLKTPVIPVFGGIFSVAIVPLVLAVNTVSAGSTTSATCPQTAGSNSDMVGGTVYFPEQDAERIITSNTYSGGNIVIGWSEALTRAVAVGDSVRAVAYARGSSPKLHASTPYSAISNVAADNTGGKLVIWDIDLKNKSVELYFLTQ